MDDHHIAVVQFKIMRAARAAIDRMRKDLDDEGFRVALHIYWCMLEDNLGSFGVWVRSQFDQDLPS